LALCECCNRGQDQSCPDGREAVTVEPEETDRRDGSCPQHTRPGDGSTIGAN